MMTTVHFHCVYENYYIHLGELHKALHILVTRPLPSPALDVLHHQRGEGRVWGVSHGFCDTSWNVDMTNQISVVTCTIPCVFGNTLTRLLERARVPRDTIIECVTVMAWSSEEIESAITATAHDLGYSQLTAHQRLVLHKFLSGSDVFVSLPTGSGKSLCYWVLPGAFNRLKKTQDSIILVVSPLIALMKDQVASLKDKGIETVYVGEKCDLDKVYGGSYPILFISPEALLTDSKWRDVLLSQVYQEQLMAVVIDEAHCVKKW